MHRRDLLKAAGAKVSGLAIVASGYGAQATSVAVDGAAELKAQVEALKTRIDDLDARDKRRCRLLVAAVAVLTGFDVSIWLG